MKVARALGYICFALGLLFSAMFSAQAEQTTTTIEIPLSNNPSGTFALISVPQSIGRNTLSEIFGTQLPEGTTLFFYSSEGYTISTFDDLDHVWMPDREISPGTPMFVQIPRGTPGSTITLTFRGESPDWGSRVSTWLPAGQKMVMLGTKLAFNGTKGISSQLNYRVEPGDILYRFDAASQSYRVSIFDEFDKIWVLSDEDESEPQIRAGEAFFLQRANLVRKEWVQQRRPDASIREVVRSAEVSYESPLYTLTAPKMLLKNLSAYDIPKYSLGMRVTLLDDQGKDFSSSAWTRRVGTVPIPALGEIYSPETLTATLPLNMIGWLSPTSEYRYRIDLNISLEGDTYTENNSQSFYFKLTGFKQGELQRTVTFEDVPDVAIVDMNPISRLGVNPLDGSFLVSSGGFSIKNVAGPAILSAGLHFRAVPVDMEGKSLCYTRWASSRGTFPAETLPPRGTVLNRWFYLSANVLSPTCGEKLGKNSVQRYRMEWAFFASGDELKDSDPFTPTTALSSNNIATRFVTVDTREPFDPWLEYE